MGFWIGIILGTIIGSNIAIIVLSLLVANKNDAYEKQYEQTIEEQ